MGSGISGGVSIPPPWRQEGTVSSYMRRLQRLLVPDSPKQDGPTTHHDPIGNQERLRRIREHLPDFGAYLPDVDAQLPSFEISGNNGVHVGVDMGSVSIGDTEVAGPQAELRAGLWNSEHGQRQGVAMGGTGLTVSTPESRFQLGRTAIRSGEMPDEDGQHLGTQSEYGLLRYEGTDGSAARLHTGNFEVGIRDLAGGSSVGFDTDQQLFAADFPITNAHFGSSSARWRVGENGYETGGTANLVSGGSSLGSVEQDPTQAEISTSLSGSEGEGFGVRARWGGDEDGDQRETVGGGVDVGPVSLDHYEENWRR